MLKNRDTDSNPYRVPPQPTPTWVKVSIPLLFILLLSTIGAVVFLAFFRIPKCSCEADTVDRGLEQKDEAERREDTMRGLHRDFSNLNIEVARMKNKISQIESRCKRCRQSDNDLPRSGVSTSPSLTLEERKLQRKVTEIESYAQGIGKQLDEHVNSEQEICRKGHWRHGVHCYVVVDATVDQSTAKEECRFYSQQASLAIIKDKFVQDFVSRKLVDRSNSYWIGIERNPPQSSVQSYSMSSDLVPSASRSANSFTYSDGTRVQRHVYSMWEGRESAERESGSRNCAAMSFDNVRSQWLWKESPCSNGMGFICQYYILSSYSQTK